MPRDVKQRGMKAGDWLDTAPAPVSFRASRTPTSQMRTGKGNDELTSHFDESI